MSTRRSLLTERFCKRENINGAFTTGKWFTFMGGGLRLVAYPARETQRSESRHEALNEFRRALHCHASLSFREWSLNLEDYSSLHSTSSICFSAAALACSAVSNIPRNLPPNALASQREPPGVSISTITAFASPISPSSPIGRSR